MKTKKKVDDIPAQLARIHFEHMAKELEAAGYSVNVVDLHQYDMAVGHLANQFRLAGTEGTIQ